MLINRWLLLICLWMGGISCNSGEKPIAVYPVQGSLLTADGKAAIGAVVTFHPKGATKYPFTPFGVVNKDGSFRLTSYASGDGAPAGEYAVTVSWRAENPEGDAGGPDKLNGKFADPAKPLRIVTVQPSENHLEPIRLK